MSDKIRKIAVMFPGQGSQFLGMGEEFLAAGNGAVEIMELAEEISGVPLRRLISEGPLEELTQTVNLQPAITAINLICWSALLKAGVEVDYVIGHSLGEYSALYAAGVLSMKDTFSLVAARGRLMEREGEKHPGGMRAVLGFTLDEIQGIIGGVKPEDGIVVAANHNTPQQVVISGDFRGLDAAEILLQEKGAKIIPLNVSIANHSPLLSGAVSDFVKIMAGLDIKRPGIPLLFNVSGKEEEDPNAIKDTMARHMDSMVQWVATLERLFALGADTFIEVGPKAVLSGLLKKTLGRNAEYSCFQIDNPEKIVLCKQKLCNNLH